VEEEEEEEDDDDASLQAIGQALEQHLSDRVGLLLLLLDQVIVIS